MREIKFRAISECRGEGLVYGDLRHYARNPHTEKWTIYDPATGIETDIVEDTIGQFLCHHDDQDIYEGDIVENEWGERFSVEWDDSASAFYLYNPKEDSHTPMDEFCINVIGNIHEHLELLEARN